MVSAALLNLKLGLMSFQDLIDHLGLPVQKYRPQELALMRWMSIVCKYQDRQPYAQP